MKWSWNKSIDQNHDFLSEFTNNKIIVCSGYSSTLANQVNNCTMNIVWLTEDSIRSSIVNLMKNYNPSLSKIQEIYNLLD